MGGGGQVYHLSDFRYTSLTMADLIQPRVLKGFRDILPEAEIVRAGLQEKITGVYRSYGFVPIDTPALEYSEVLLRKSGGETEKQVFRFLDNGGRDVALRFDLTVPLARFTAEHEGELYFPLKRYHIAKVWRGEKPQAGRYREFVQCDIDTVGSDSAASDFEILSVMRAALAEVGAGGFTIRVSHRGVFNRFLTRLGEAGRSEDILRSVDKLAKVGADEVRRELSMLTGSDGKAADIMRYVAGAGTFDDTLSLMEEMAGGEAEDTRRLREIREMMTAAGIGETYRLDPSITRGLDYYTGMVYETFLDELPSIGSVCSGGRYDDLAGLYTKTRLPGVGGSIGLDRLIAALEQLGRIEPKGSYIDAEIFCMDKGLAVLYQKVAARLRDKGVSVEVFPEARKMAQQYAVTEAKKVGWGILIGTNEAERNAVTLKNLRTREQFAEIPVDEAAGIILAAKGR